METNLPSRVTRHASRTYTLGIDIGSGFSKAVICEGTSVRATAVVPSGGNYKETAGIVTAIVLKQINLTMEALSCVVSTGYGAGMVGFSQRSVTDIACHATAIHHLFPSARTVIDVGAQFSKVIRVDDRGKAANFILNEKCAGGSGKFLQVIARILHIDIEEIGKLSSTSIKPVEFTTGCAVFAESEAVSRIAEGALPGDILAGVHKAMASKIANLVIRLGLLQDCALTGGGAKDSGLVRAIETELGVPILVPDNPQFTAALGAALLAAES